VITVGLLVLSNLFMTFAWYRHLGAQRDAPIWIAVLTSWGIAFFEYCLAVPANRLGSGQFDLPQLKLIQEVVTLVVFAVVAAVFFKARFGWNHLAAGACLVGAVWFTFQAG
jgi:uncharacterized protein (DUF486 family)